MQKPESKSLKQAHHYIPQQPPSAFVLAFDSMIDSDGDNQQPQSKPHMPARDRFSDPAYARQESIVAATWRAIRAEVK